MDITRPLSWSAISSFQYNPEQWARRYCDGIQPPESPEMLFGKQAGEKYATDPTFHPSIPRHSTFEYPLAAQLGDINLVGYIDSYEPHTHLMELKTGKRPWDKKRVDGHFQLDMYLLLLNLMHKVKPHDVQVRLAWLPTQENGDFTIFLVPDARPVIFETERTMTDILNFGVFINDTFKQMQQYAHARALR